MPSLGVRSPCLDFSPQKQTNKQSKKQTNKQNNKQKFDFQVFLGGLPSTITETDLRSFFSNYGEVCEVVIMYDQEKKKSRGFGFLSFENEIARERAVADYFVMIFFKNAEKIASNYILRKIWLDFTL